MTTAVCKQLTSELIDAGCKITLVPRAQGDWLVRAEMTTGTVDTKQVAQLANKYAVSSDTNQAEFV